MPENRIAAAENICKKYRCSHLLVTDPVDIEYLCGFSSSHATMLLSGGKNLLFTDFRYQEAAETFCKKRKSWRFIPMKGGGFTWLSGELPSGSKTGFQSDCMTVDELERLRKALQGVRFVPISRDISDLALCKTTSETACIEKAAAFGDSALKWFWGRLKPGITERAAAQLLDCLCSDCGSEKPSFDTIVLFGERTSLPHGRPGMRKLKKGDFILVDFGCTANGFCSDMTRTAVCGRASARQREIYDIVKNANAAAVQAARSGMSGSALDAVGRAVIEQAGYGASFGHGLGHGVGRRIHERPGISPQSNDFLPEGCIVTIEPGIYLPLFGGVRIEDMILLGKKRSRLLTACPRELIEL